MSQNVYEGPAAWTATEMRHRHDDWIVTLDAGAIAELKGAVEASRAIPIVDLAASDFPLPTLVSTCS